MSLSQKMFCYNIASHSFFISCGSLEIAHEINCGPLVSPNPCRTHTASLEWISCTCTWACPAQSRGKVNRYVPFSRSLTSPRPPAFRAGASSCARNRSPPWVLGLPALVVSGDEDGLQVASQGVAGLGRIPQVVGGSLGASGGQKVAPISWGQRPVQKMGQV